MASKVQESTFGRPSSPNWKPVCDSLDLLTAPKLDLYSRHQRARSPTSRYRPRRSPAVSLLPCSQIPLLLPKDWWKMACRRTSMLNSLRRRKHWIWQFEPCWRISCIFIRWVIDTLSMPYHNAPCQTQSIISITNTIYNVTPNSRATNDGTRTITSCDRESSQPCPIPSSLSSVYSPIAETCRPCTVKVPRDSRRKRSVPSESTSGRTSTHCLLLREGRGRRPTRLFGSWEAKDHPKRMPLSSASLLQRWSAKRRRFLLLTITFKIPWFC